MMDKPAALHGPPIIEGLPAVVSSNARSHGSKHRLSKRLIGRVQANLGGPLQTITSVSHWYHSLLAKHR
jgi:hypothetical protein